MIFFPFTKKRIMTIFIPLLSLTILFLTCFSLQYFKIVNFLKYEIDPEFPSPTSSNKLDSALFRWPVDSIKLDASTILIEYGKLNTRAYIRDDSCIYVNSEYQGESYGVFKILTDSNEAIRIESDSNGLYLWGTPDEVVRGSMLQKKRSGFLFHLPLLRYKIGGMVLLRHRISVDHL